MNNKKQKQRIISFPQMGNIGIPIKAMLKCMGANVLMPSNNNIETLNYGTKHSYETVCLPYKLNLGNYIQVLEQGANVLLMFRAPGTCRLGNYAFMAEAKLKELGYDFEMVVFDMYKGKLIEIARKFNYAIGEKASFSKILYGIKLGFAKFDALDTIERKLFYVRPRAINPEKAEKIYNLGVNNIDKALNVKEVKDAVSATLDMFNYVQLDNNKEILKVYLTGEFFVLLDPFTNMGIEKELGLLGVEVERQIMLSDWTNNALLPNWINKKESHRERAYRIAGKYIKRAVGGECLESIGDVVYAARENINGVVHLSPFNCNPEIVSQCILPQVSKSENIPVISLIMDEQKGKAGFVTRLEAFTDLMYRRKRTKITA